MIVDGFKQISETGNREVSLVDIRHQVWSKSRCATFRRTLSLKVAFLIELMENLQARCYSLESDFVHLRW